MSDHQTKNLPTQDALSQREILADEMANKAALRAASDFQEAALKAASDFEAKDADKLMLPEWVFNGATALGALAGLSVGRARFGRTASPWAAATGDGWLQKAKTAMFGIADYKQWPSTLAMLGGAAIGFGSVTWVSFRSLASYAMGIEKGVELAHAVENAKVEKMGKGAAKRMEANFLKQGYVRDERGYFKKPHKAKDEAAQAEPAKAGAETVASNITHDGKLAAAAQEMAKTV